MAKTKISKELKADWEALKRLRDEARVKLHLAGMDAKATWEKLSAEAEQIAREADAASNSALKDLVKRFNDFVTSLKEIANEERPHG